MTAIFPQLNSISRRCASTTHSTQEKETVDGKIAFEVATAYFCTGDPTWFEQITDPALEFFCDLLYTMICKGDLPHIEKIVSWVTDLQVSMGTDTGYQDCMRERAVEGIGYLFCEGEKSVDSMGALMKFLAKWTCEADVKEWQGYPMMCQAFLFLQKFAKSFVFGLAPLVCGNLSEHRKSKREVDSNEEFGRGVPDQLHDLDDIDDQDNLEMSVTKRQYDLSSMMNFLENLVCDKSVFLLVSKYVEKDFVKEEGIADVASLLHGFFCCTLIAIDT